MPDPINVLHIFGSYLPATQSWAYNLIRNMRDVKVKIGAPVFEQCNFYNSEFLYLEFPLKAITYQREKLWVRIYNKFSKIATRFYPSFLRYVARPVDLIHSHFADVGWNNLGLARSLQVPHFVSFYGYDYEYIPNTQPIWRRRYQELFARADFFLCEGKYGARILQQMGCPSEKIHICRLGVILAERPEVARDKHPHELSLVQVATFSEKKGQKYTAEAFIRCIEHCPNMRLTFVGKGDASDGPGSKESIRRLLQGTLAEDKVQFIDFVDFKELGQFLAGFHVFIHPSCKATSGDCEGGAPVVLLDAQCTGMPVISTTHCDIPEEVLDGETGLLSPERDMVHLAESIERFYKMANEEYRGFCRNARTHVERNYDVSNNAQILRSMYEVSVRHKSCG